MLPSQAPSPYHSLLLHTCLPHLGTLSASHLRTVWMLAAHSKQESTGTRTWYVCQSRQIPERNSRKDYIWHIVSKVSIMANWLRRFSVFGKIEQHSRRCGEQRCSHPHLIGADLERVKKGEREYK